MVRRLRLDIATICLLASAVVLIFGQPAGAGLVLRTINVELNASAIESYDLDVDLDGTTDFTFTSAFVPDPVVAAGFNTIDFPFGLNNAVVIDTRTGDGFPTVSRLAAGDIVSSANTFSAPALDQGNLTFFTTFDPPSGNFAGQSGFVGLRFDRFGDTTFGFAQVTVNAMDATVNPLGLTIGTVGFNNLPGQPATVTVVPEPSSFFLGACGLGLFSFVRCRAQKRS